MDKQQILDYIKFTPANSNPNVLGAMLDELIDESQQETKPEWKSWRLIRNFVNPELSGIGIIADENGDPFALSKFVIVFECQADGGGVAPITMYTKSVGSDSWDSGVGFTIPPHSFTEQKSYVIDGRLNGFWNVWATLQTDTLDIGPVVGPVEPDETKDKPITAFRFNRYTASELPPQTTVKIYGLDAE